VALLLLGLQLPPFLSSLLVQEPEPIDFAQEWASARNWWQGAAVYADQRETLPRLLDLPPPPGGQRREWYIVYNAHPPGAVLLGLPFGLLTDYHQAAALWNLLSLAALLAAVAVMLTELGVRVAPWLWLPLLGAALLYNPLRQQVNQGQLNGVLLLVLTLAWRCWRRERQACTGLWLAVATVLKLFPGFLFLLLLARGQWRGLWVGVGAGLVLTLVGVIVLGLPAHVDYVTKVLPAVHDFRCGKLNASLAGLFTKLFVGSEFEKVRPWLAAPGLAWGLTVAAGLGLAMLVIWHARRRPADQAFSLALVAMTLASPITWDHSLLLLTLPLIWLSQQASSPARRLGLMGVVLVFGFHHHGCWRVGAEQGWLPEVFGVAQTLGLASLLCYAQLLLLGLLCPPMAQERT
jgi:hypothetical protein